MSTITYARLAAAALVATLALWSADPAVADGKVTEQNMTQNDYNGITQIDANGGPALPSPPIPIHDLTANGKTVVNAGHGVKIVKGKDWRNMSPQDRYKFLSDFRKNAQAGTVFMIEVPSGNVWAINETTYDGLVEGGGIRPWSQSEKEALPKAVRGDASNRPEIRRSEGARFDVFSQF
ncbi:MAG TPA: hypothetical protein VMT54_00215 [Candidatus Cybelea sp.]|nr:hypothetical protein [Candidatus Cybelea sp.]